MKKRGKKWDRAKGKLPNIKKGQQQTKTKRRFSLMSREQVVRYNYQKRIAVSQQNMATQ